MRHVAGVSVCPVGGVHITSRPSRRIIARRPTGHSRPMRKQRDQHRQRQSANPIKERGGRHVLHNANDNRIQAES